MIPSAAYSFEQRSAKPFTEGTLPKSCTSASFAMPAYNNIYFKFQSYQKSALLKRGFFSQKNTRINRLHHQLYFIRVTSSLDLLQQHLKEQCLEVLS